jgi:hypothetical protein
VLVEEALGLKPAKMPSTRRSRHRALLGEVGHEVGMFDKSDNLTLPRELLVKSRKNSKLEGRKENFGGKLARETQIKGRLTRTTPDPWIKSNQNSVETTNCSKSGEDIFMEIFVIGKNKTD